MVNRPLLQKIRRITKQLGTSVKMINRPRLRQIQNDINKLGNLLNRIDAALVIRDPGNARSADAYDGLRKMISAGGKGRRDHLHNLVDLAQALERGATLETIRERTEEWCDKAGIIRHESPEPADYFIIVEGEGSVIEVVTPAWIDKDTTSLIRKGTTRRVPNPDPNPDSTEVEEET